MDKYKTSWRIKFVNITLKNYLHSLLGLRNFDDLKHNHEQPTLY